MLCPIIIFCKIKDLTNVSILAVQNTLQRKIREAACLSISLCSENVYRWTPAAPMGPSATSSHSASRWERSKEGKCRDLTHTPTPGKFLKIKLFDFIYIPSSTDCGFLRYLPGTKT